MGSRIADEALGLLKLEILVYTTCTPINKFHKKTKISRKIIQVLIVLHLCVKSWP